MSSMEARLKERVDKAEKMIEDAIRLANGGITKNSPAKKASPSRFGSSSSPDQPSDISPRARVKSPIRNTKTLVTMRVRCNNLITKSGWDENPTATLIGLYSFNNEHTQMTLIGKSEWVRDTPHPTFTARFEVKQPEPMVPVITPHNSETGGSALMPAYEPNDATPNLLMFRVYQLEGAHSLRGSATMVVDEKAFLGSTTFSLTDVPAYGTGGQCTLTYDLINPYVPAANDRLRDAESSLIIDFKFPLVAAHPLVILTPSLPVGVALNGMDSAPADATLSTPIPESISNEPFVMSQKLAASTSPLLVKLTIQCKDLPQIADFLTPIAALFVRFSPASKFKYCGQSDSRESGGNIRYFLDPLELIFDPTAQGSQECKFSFYDGSGTGPLAESDRIGSTFVMLPTLIAHGERSEPVYLPISPARASLTNPDEPDETGDTTPQETDPAQDATVANDLTSHIGILVLNCYLYSLDGRSIVGDTSTNGTSRGNYGYDDDGKNRLLTNGVETFDPDAEGIELKLPDQVLSAEEVKQVKEAKGQGVEGQEREIGSGTSNPVEGLEPWETEIKSEAIKNLPLPAPDELKRCKLLMTNGGWFQSYYPDHGPSVRLGLFYYEQRTTLSNDSDGDGWKRCLYFCDGSDTDAGFEMVHDQCIPLKAINEIWVGKHADSFHDNADDSCCFSVVASSLNQALHLEAPDTKSRADWLFSLISALSEVPNCIAYLFEPVPKPGTVDHKRVAALEGDELIDALLKGHPVSFHLAAEGDEDFRVVPGEIWYVQETSDDGVISHQVHYLVDGHEFMIQMEHITVVTRGQRSGVWPAEGIDPSGEVAAYCFSLLTDDAQDPGVHVECGQNRHRNAWTEGINKIISTQYGWTPAADPVERQTDNFNALAAEVALDSDDSETSDDDSPPKDPLIVELKCRFLVESAPNLRDGPGDYKNMYCVRWQEPNGEFKYHGEQSSHQPRATNIEWPKRLKFAHDLNAKNRRVMEVSFHEIGPQDTNVTKANKVGQVVIKMSDILEDLATTRKTDRRWALTHSSNAEMADRLQIQGSCIGIRSKVDKKTSAMIRQWMEEEAAELAAKQAAREKRRMEKKLEANQGVNLLKRGGKFTQYVASRLHATDKGGVAAKLKLLDPTEKAPCGILRVVSKNGNETIDLDVPLHKITDVYPGIQFPIFPETCKPNNCFSLLAPRKQSRGGDVYLHLEASTMKKANLWVFGILNLLQHREKRPIVHH